jgi:hypothetical protein
VRARRVIQGLDPHPSPIIERSEKDEEHAGDQLMAMTGFEIVRFSQPRNTMQTPGVSDRLYIHRARKLAVWWEAKRVGGKQSAHQRKFQELVTAVDWDYVAGPLDALVEWVHSARVVRLR